MGGKGRGYQGCLAQGGRTVPPVPESIGECVEAAELGPQRHRWPQHPSHADGLRVRRERPVQGMGPHVLDAAQALGQGSPHDALPCLG